MCCGIWQHLGDAERRQPVAGGFLGMTVEMLQERYGLIIPISRRMRLARCRRGLPASFPPE